MLFVVRRSVSLKCATDKDKIGRNLCLEMDRWSQ